MNKLGNISITAMVAVVAWAFICFGQTWGDNQNWDSAEEVTRERPKKMQDVSELESAISELDESPSGSGGKQEFVPLNEVIITKKTEVDTVAAAKPKNKGQKIGNSVGARFGFGNPLINVGIMAQVGLSETGRIDAGINGSFFGYGQDEYGILAFEGLIFYEWRFNLSDDGALAWYFGPGVAAGYYYPYKDTTITVTIMRPDSTTYDDTIKEKTKTSKGGVGMGVGAQIGLEVPLSFIDPEHSLYKLFKKSAISLDVRPMIYLTTVKHYPLLLFNVGIEYKYVF